MTSQLKLFSSIDTMKTIQSLVATISFATCLISLSPSGNAATWELRDGDRVVFLGDALIEQEQYSGWLEVMLSTAFPERDVTFRNLGWSADTPIGDSRFGLSLLQAGREPADEGWKQLVKQIELTKPTVVVFGYGMASALEGGIAGVEKFTRDYQRLLDAIHQISPEARFVFLSPISQVDTGHTNVGQSSLDRNNTALKAYSSAIRDIAASNGKTYVDLSSVASNADQRKDPIHLNDAGYRAAAIAVGKQLGLPADWTTSPHTEALRSVILRKNVWWFHRSRPANMAYVFGFRKREQGQNAVEIPKFDPLIAEEEQAIASLRKLQEFEIQPKQPQVKSQYAKFTKQPTPEFTVGDDLEVTLWAENPQLNKPIQMNFDPAGRLWIASSEAYPMIEVGQAAPDKILVLEDTNGDGKADASTVFADGLLIPTGVEPGDGGCYVAQSTDLLFLKDTDGDGKADVKRRVLSGFGTEDTHHNLHTLRWGPDGRLYMNQSIYTRSDAETPRGIVRLKAGGGFRYNPATMRMQIVFRGLVNSWGHQFDAYGQSFLTDGAGGAGIAYSFPGAAFNPAPGTRRVLDLISPGRYPKFASAEIIYGDAYPPEWQGSVVTCDFRANRVTRFSMTEQDAGFVTKQEDDLLRTSASTFRPIDVKQGPDGALYIADWSNPIINHGEVDFRDERRDRWHGRIWRVTWKGGKTKKKEDLTKLDNEALFTRLTSDDRYTRDQARRVLLERKEQIADSVADWTKNADNEDAKLQAIWLQQGLDQVNASDVIALTSAKDHKVRAAAIRIVSDLADPETDATQPLSPAVAMKILNRAAQDKHPRVRLEAIRGLGKMRTAEAASAALQAINHPRDRFLDFALATTMDELTDPFMKALNGGQWKPDSPQRERQLDFVLTNIDPARAASYLSAYLATNRIPADGQGPWIELIGKAGGKAELTKLFNRTINRGFNPAATTRALNAISNAQRLRKQRPAGDLNQITKLLDTKNAEVEIAAMRLIGNWRLVSQVNQLAKAAGDGSTERVRATATQALRDIGKPATTALTKLAQSSDIATRKRSVIALTGLDPNLAAEPFYAALAETQDEQEALDFWRGILNMKNAGKVIAKQLPKNGVSEFAAQAGLIAAKDAGRNEPDLIAALIPYAGTVMKAQELTPDRVAELIRLVENEGNPGRGESVYSRTELQCIKCHAIGGVGGKVGPDMTSLGASAPVDYLIESIYKPNAKIKENYHSVNVLTVDGLVINGIVVESDADELVLRDSNNKIVKVAQDDIEVQKPGQSLMPQGLVDRLTQQEQVDLIKFLTQLGRPGNYDASKGGVARVYDVLPSATRGDARVLSGELKAGWVPLMSRVNGTIFGNSLAGIIKASNDDSLAHVYLRTNVESASDGQVTFSVNGADTADLWIDGNQIDGKTIFTAKLNAGTHSVLVRLDSKKLPASFRLVSRDVAFATE
jgi:putative heme-binding domain-containing protein